MYIQALLLPCALSISPALKGFAGPIDRLTFFPFFDHLSTQETKRNTGGKLSIASATGGIATNDFHHHIISIGRKI
jgi:hypothetical protein